MRKQVTISKILKLKENRKKEVEIEVKKASDRADEEKSRLQDLEKNYLDTLEYFNEKHSEGSLNVHHLTSYYDFFSRINGKITEQKKVHAQRQSELKSLNKTLVNAHKEKKVFEILHDKNEKREHRDKLVSEQKEADFIAILRKSR